MHRINPAACFLRMPREVLIGVEVLQQDEIVEDVVAGWWT
jgi:hypothetical protein